MNRPQLSAKPTVICAWCSRVMTEGSGGVSHGICPECGVRIMEAADRHWEEGLRRVAAMASAVGG